MILRLFRRDPRAPLLAKLYARIVDAALRPGLYRDLGVPDTLEGRFEAVALHVILVLRRLRALPSPADEVAQDLVDHFFRQMDSTLRETGVGDMGVPKRMKKLAQSFYGRARTLDPAIDARDEARLKDLLARNVTGGPDASGLAAYALAADAALGETSLDALLKRGPVFPAVERYA